MLNTVVDLLSLDVNFESKYAIYLNIFNFNSNTLFVFCVISTKPQKRTLESPGLHKISVTL